MRHPNSGSPEVGIMSVQVGNSRLGCADPESRRIALWFWIPGSREEARPGMTEWFPHGTHPRDVLCCIRACSRHASTASPKGGIHMSLGLILVIILIIFLLGGFSGRFGGYGYGMGHSGMGLGGLILVVLLVLLLLGKL
jgi:hypothetical protein